jgi:hypothetical protein
VVFVELHKDWLLEDNEALPADLQVEVEQDALGRRIYSRDPDRDRGEVPFHLGPNDRPEPGRFPAFRSGRDRLAFIEPTTTWFVEALASYLER